jgi:hypothetical protein
MQGACSNQVVKCVIYTNDAEAGVKKLLEIETEKNTNGIKTTRKIICENYSEIDFDDEEEWIVLKASDTARGYRWRKAWVDIDTSIRVLERIIKPSGMLYQWEEEKYFDGRVLNEQYQKYS